MTRPEITVGIPCHNSAATLDRAITSVRAQTHGNWRLILSDDCSEDETWELCAAAAASDPRITAARQTERRMFMNFGDLLAASQTPYFVWLAADDYWAPDFLRLTKRCLDTHPDSVSALPRCEFVGPEAPPHPPTPSLDEPVAVRVRHFLARPGGTRMYGLFRTPVLQEAFPPRNMNAYDWYVMLAVLRAGPQLEVPETLLFREHTPWMRYVDMVDRLYSRRVFRRYPTLDMSLQALRDGKVGRANLGDLLGMNLRKHEEYLAVSDPDAYLRRARMFRWLGLPLSTNPSRIAAVALQLAHHAPDRRDGALRILEAEAARGSKPAAQALEQFRSEDGSRPARAHLSPIRTRVPSGRSAKLPPPVTAILTCRNAEGMLARQLEHLSRAGARTIVVDHGSTDRTRVIAEAHLGDLVSEIIDEPFDGTFDLTRQMHLKRQIIATLPDGWVLHVDADEFLDAPHDRTLQDVVSALDATPALAVGCEERLFLPARESDVHSAEGFEQSLQTYVVLAERDPKQRLFRAGAPLDVWMETAGHTVCRDRDGIGPERLVLRHYIGLSLDDVRAQYYARVFAREDVGKSWHFTRMAARNYEVIEPDGTLLQRSDLNRSPDVSTVRELPVFAPIKAVRGADLPVESGSVDLLILSAPSDRSRTLSKEIAERHSELRFVFIEDPFAVVGWKPPFPLLNLLEHPVSAIGAATGDVEVRQVASNWVRRIANARQASLAPGRCYRELRVEDVAGQWGSVGPVLRDLILRTPGPSERGFVLTGGAVHAEPDWSPIVRRIAGPLATDLNYR